MKISIKKGIYYVIALLLVIYIGVSILLPNKSLDIFGFRTFIVVSSSMEPDISVEDMILITKTNEEELEAGDVITFNVYIPELKNYNYVTHYIAKVETNDSNQIIYKTHGANKEIDDVDEWTNPQGELVDITIEDIEGQYRFTLPLLGPLVTRLQDPLFVGLLVLNVAVLVFAYRSIVDYIKTRNEDEKKEIE